MIRRLGAVWFLLCALPVLAEAAATRTPTPSPSPTPLPTVSPLPRQLLPTRTPPAAGRGALAADCNGDGEVTIDELLIGVNIALGARPLSACPAFDLNGDGEVTIDELLVAVNIALGGPPPATPTPILGDREAALIGSSPAHGEGGVALSRETILRFSAPLDPASVTLEAIDVTFGGGEVLRRLHLSPDRTTVTVFYTVFLPAAARIRVTVDGNKLRAAGRPVDADGDGTPGGIARIDFDTLSIVPVAGTAVCGRVFASELVPGGNGTSLNQPLKGVLIEVDGNPDLRAVTDQFGNFRLEPAPAGRFFVYIVGTMAEADLPPGAYYPNVGKAWRAIPGQENNIGDIFLPLIKPGTLQPVSRTQDTEVRFPSEVQRDFPELADVLLSVPADSLYANDGTRGGMVGIAPVAPDRIPSRLPLGLELPLVITVQTDGAENFDRPVPTCFPNLPDPSTGQPPAPGEKTHLYSFNHDIGEFEPVGPMTVTADGRLTCTDPGVGILAPGWHGSGPPPVNPPPPPPPLCQPPGGGVAGLGGGAQGNDCDCDVEDAKERLCEQQARTNFSQNYLNCIAVAATIAALCVAAKSLPCLVAAALIGGLCLGVAEKKRDQDLQQCALNNPCNIVITGGGTSAIAGDIPPLDDPAAQRIAEIVEEIPPLFANLVIGGQEVPESIFDEIMDRLDEANRVAGGDAVEYLRSFSLRLEEQVAALNAQIGEATGNAPPYPIRFAAEILRANGPLRLRGETQAFGQYTLFVPRDGTLAFVSFYDPRTKRYGLVFPNERPDAPFRLPRVTLVDLDDTFGDFDNDGLPDVVEFVYGTDTANPDSDGDGVSDGAEVDQGTDPLDGRPARTGIIATADTPGTAIDVCAVNDIAVVADSDRGVSMFNVFNGMDPVIVAQVDTPGSGERVACAGSLIAVADGSAGLAIIDVRDPPAAHIRHRLSLGGSVRAVTAAGGIGYAGTETGQLVAVDLASGTVIEQVGTGGAVHDVAIEGDTVFVVLFSELQAYSAFPELAFLGRTSLSSFQPEGITGRRRLFVGGGIAYTSAFPGFDTYDVTNPTAIRRLGSARDEGPNSFKQVVANGSGLGVAAVGVNPRDDGTHDVYLYDISDPAETSAFLTLFSTPGLTRAVSIYNGLAYAADGEAGLQVLNYLPYDAMGVPPTISLKTNFAEGRAEEGQIFRVTAAVADDVQVRNVEFFIDGVKVATDGNFPFEQHFRTPLQSVQPSFRLQARASDTGGNATLTEEITITLVSDATPPRVRRVAPGQGAILPNASVVAAFFSEPIDRATLAPATFALTWSGPDGLLDTADDSAISGRREFRDDLLAAFLVPSDTLPSGRYRARLTAAIADLAGNRLAAPFVWEFSIFDIGADRDGDGVPDDLEALLGLDPDNPDSDGDGIPDGDEDFDNDGLSNFAEVVLGTDPTNPDSNGNGVRDGDEDSDGDGLTDGEEVRRGTNSRNPDTDGDGWPDGAEVDAGTSPLSSASQPHAGVVAAPPVTVVVQAAGDVMGLVPNTTVASPPVSVVVQELGGDVMGLAANTTVASPPVSVVVQQIGDVMGLAPNTTVAQPPVSVRIEGQ
jgi:hypothetical protein